MLVRESFGRVKLRAKLDKKGIRSWALTRLSSIKLSVDMEKKGLGDEISFGTNFGAKTS
jgi:hypothetical protein